MHVTDFLTTILRLAGAGLITLAMAHIPIGRHLNWREDISRLTPVNASIFRVHNLFICLVLIIMGLPCVFDPTVFLERSRAAGWLTWSFCAFWALRLYVQWCVYEAELWRGKRMETFLHYSFTVIWLGLTLLFGACGLFQMGWLGDRSG